MPPAAAPLFLLLASLATSGTLPEGGAGNGSAADGGLVPLAATRVTQIIAREGSCVLMDCNVSGEPFPSFQWFNSHGRRLDTESEGEAPVTPVDLFRRSGCGNPSASVWSAAACGHLAFLGRGPAGPVWRFEGRLLNS